VIFIPPIHESVPPCDIFRLRIFFAVSFRDISMAQPPYFMDDHGDHRLDLIPPSTLDVNNPSGGDPSSMSYIPRATRSAPRAHIVHTIHVKKITYPLSTRPDELWILEINQDGLETWRSIESFLTLPKIIGSFEQLRTNGVSTTIFNPPQLPPQ
jgi:hypothetical protein